MRIQRYALLIAACVGLLVSACASNTAGPSSTLSFQATVDSKTLTATFKVTGGSTTTASWDNGDGTTVTGNPVTHQYQKSQDYTVTLTVPGQTPVSQVVHVQGMTVELRGGGITETTAPGTGFSFSINSPSAPGHDVPQSGIIKVTTRNLNPTDGSLKYYLFASIADSDNCIHKQHDCSTAVLGPIAAVNGEVTIGYVTTTDLYLGRFNWGTQPVSFDGVSVTITAGH